MTRSLSRFYGSYDWILIWRGTMLLSGRMLICFIGVDGSGKTTHAKSLLRFLSSKGYSVKYVRAASRPVLIYPFLALTRVLGYWNTVKDDAYTDPLEKTAPNIKKGIAPFFRFLLFIDYELINFLKIQSSLLTTRVVLCDRYVYDLIIDLALSNLHSRNFANLLLKTTSRPTKTFFTDSSGRVLMQRRANMSRKTTFAKLKAYRKLARVLGFTTINTEDAFETSQDSIRRQVLPLLER